MVDRSPTPSLPGVISHARIKDDRGTPGPETPLRLFKVSTASLASGNIPPGRRCDAIANTTRHRSVRESDDLLPPSARRTPVWSATSGPTGLRVILLQQPAGRFVVCSGSGPGLRKGCSRNQKSQRQISLHLGGGGSPYEGQQLLVRGIHSPGLLPRVVQGPSKLVQASNRRITANGGAPQWIPKLGPKGVVASAGERREEKDEKEAWHLFPCIMDCLLRAF
ncbi:hypothetical protein BKA56DRAFT_337627 [Ilyonectria sp. MPI-CAGE-AT-0026]|nr:hypothetical protein BKA56DRAFT_337627 [Ilyonectria sp. MPI-CAGE-AT-0026]